MYPKATCGAIIAKNKKILLTKRGISPYKNYWCLPGGHIEWEESTKEAIKREIKEEIGLDFKPIFFNYCDEIIPEIKWHAVSLFFEGKVKGKIKINQSEIKEFRWFSQKEIKNIKLAFSHKEILRDYFKNKK